LQFLASKLVSRSLKGQKTLQLHNVLQWIRASTCHHRGPRFDTQSELVLSLERAIIIFESVALLQELWLPPTSHYKLANYVFVDAQHLIQYFIGWSTTDNVIIS
jgi:hypothetical protein